MTLRVSRSWVLLATVAAVGCSGQKDTEETRLPIGHAEAALTAQQNTERALKGLVDAGGFIAESASVAQSLSSLAGSSESCSGSYVTPACADGTPNCDTTPVYQETCVTEPNEVTVEDLEEARQDMRDSVDDLVQQLRDEIFTEANLESDTGTEVVYRLGADVLCGEDESDDVASAPLPADAGVAADAGSSVTELPTIDEECAADVAKLEPRLRLTSPGEGDIDVDVLLTSAKKNPVSFELYHDLLGVVVDLGELKELLDSADQTPEGLSALDGKMSLELVKNAERDFSIRCSVLEDLLVTADQDGEQVTVKLEASSPTGEVRLDGNARTISGTYDMSKLAVTAPLGAFFSDDEESYDDSGNPVAPRTYTGLIHMLLGGLNGSLTFDGNTDVLNFNGLGLGDVSTTVHHDDNLLLELDVNPDQDRRFDLKVESSGDSNPILTFSPTLDIRLQLAFEKLADQIPDLDSFLLNDTVRLWFDGAHPSVQGTTDSLRVVSGTLHIDSEKAPDSSLTIPSGMCLVEGETAEEQEATSLASAFAAGACE
ncbi:MAG: hypothetical protein JW940_09445 [Polyangiaceae bacterium]|nr:hypothetical protein [Polyangiaceae bacterium]